MGLCLAIAPYIFLTKINLAFSDKTVKEVVPSLCLVVLVALGAGFFIGNLTASNTEAPPSQSASDPMTQDDFGSGSNDGESAVELAAKYDEMKSYYLEAAKKTLGAFPGEFASNDGSLDGYYFPPSAGTRDKMCLIQGSDVFTNPEQMDFSSAPDTVFTRDKSFQILVTPLGAGDLYKPDKYTSIPTQLECTRRADAALSEIEPFE